ncbi:hypothetical protein [Streptomyces odontomachi]|uniref:hypothetical protein n=1 Tax=Streptomyces odontomachi TaxID=2944940 RepID=UPI0021097298|nr:hypothetical protein [Streptomyces sp. ODS25]
MTSLDPFAAAHLVQRWAPVHHGTAHAAFWSVAVRGSAPPPEERSWADPPSPAEVAEYGGFPQAFAAAGGAGLRHPVGVRPLNHAIGRKGRPWTRARPAEEVAAELDRLLTGVLSAGPEALPEPVRELVPLLAQKLAADFADLVRVDVAAEPDGPPLDAELHLVGRNIFGKTLRISLAPAPSTRPPDGLWPDPRLALDGDLAAPATLSEDAYRGADLAVRADCVGRLLGEFVWLSNNERMRVTTLLEHHHGTLDPAAPDLDTAFAAWWPSTDLCAELYDEEWWEEGTAPRRLDEGTLARVQTDFEAHNLQLAWSGAWVMGEVADDDAPTEHWSDTDRAPAFPGDRLVTLLGRDLFATVRAQAIGRTGDGPVAAYGIGLPFELSEEDYGVRACLLLVGAQAVGVVTIDAAA